MIQEFSLHIPREGIMRHSALTMPHALKAASVFVLILLASSGAYAQTDTSSAPARETTIFPPSNCNHGGGALYWDGIPGDPVACVGITASGGPKYQFSCASGTGGGMGCMAMNSQTGQLFYWNTGMGGAPHGWCDEVDAGNCVGLLP
jgi:hypothetical protein